MRMRMWLLLHEAVAVAVGVAVAIGIGCGTVGWRRLGEPCQSRRWFIMRQTTRTHLDMHSCPLPRHLPSPSQSNEKRIGEWHLTLERDNEQRRAAH